MHIGRLEREIVGAKGIEEAIAPAADRASTLPGQVHDVAMPLLDQPIGRVARREPVTGCDAVDLHFLVFAVHQHGRDAGTRDFLQQFAPVIVQQQNAIDLGGPRLRDQLAAAEIGLIDLYRHHPDRAALALAHQPAQQRP
ncbi:hypothetical protein D3C87_1763060 [compost metagenome]